MPLLVERGSKWPRPFFRYIPIRGQLAYLHFFCLRRQLIFWFAVMVPQSSAPQSRSASTARDPGLAVPKADAGLRLELKAARTLLKILEKARTPQKLEGDAHGAGDIEI